MVVDEGSKRFLMFDVTGEMLENLMNDFGAFKIGERIILIFILVEISYLLMYLVPWIINDTPLHFDNLFISKAEYFFIESFFLFISWLWFAIKMILEFLFELLIPALFKILKTYFKILDTLEHIKCLWVMK